MASVSEGAQSLDHGSYSAIKGVAFPSVGATRTEVRDDAMAPRQTRTAAGPDFPPSRPKLGGVVTSITGDGGAVSGTLPKQSVDWSAHMMTKLAASIRLARDTFTR